MLTDDILCDLQKENIVFQKEYIRQIYDTKSFLSTGSYLKDTCYLHQNQKENYGCKGAF